MNNSTIEENTPFDKSCVRCHESFVCRADSIRECHCSAFELNAEQLAILRERYNNCLCNQCLVNFVETEAYLQY